MLGLLMVLFAIGNGASASEKSPGSGTPDTLTPNSGVVGFGSPRPLASILASSARDEPDERPRTGQNARPSNANQTKSKSSDAAKADLSWTIVLALFSEDTGEEASAYLQQVRAQPGLREAKLRTLPAGAAVVFGSFESPTSPELKRELTRVRGIMVNGQRPFARAFAAPPEDPKITGVDPELDLRNAMANYGTEMIYTLQVGVYGRDDGKPPSEKELKEFRTLAEQAAALIRRNGDLAFYFHGPARSTVTVGLFMQEDVDVERGEQSAQLKLLRQKFPHNLLNGKAIRETVPAANKERQSVKLQPSTLVLVPKG
ncbi:MAG: hypothetical protein SFZ23_04100 [Planctomycetota bacterium]|nr:hypothetical protein [Planctomycetota bacterium]